ncbi:hypothetical protein DV736_g6048, partial [Chaetothyriales sp. CBS 134916]
MGVTRADGEKTESPASAEAVANQDGHGDCERAPVETVELSHPSQRPSRLLQALSVLNWKPRWCRWDPDSPPKFSIWLNILFAFAGAFTVANLYYNHPILNILAESFDVPYLTISHVPTLMQGGYATGLLFICPLADLFPRRPYTLLLVFFTATMWIGLCVTNNLTVFLVLSYLTAVTTVTPQIMLPLVAELAPPEKRTFSLSIVVSGNLLGIVLARILSGVVTNYTYWRNIYWIALGLNYGIWSMLWLFMPDYPSANPNGLNYFSMLWSIPVMCKRHAVLVFAGIVSYCNSAAFMNYWTTLTFLLAGPPYHYNSVYIGLFALIGIAAILVGPVYAKYLIQPFLPWFAVVIGEAISLAAVVIGTYTGRHTVAGPIIQALGLDAGFQITQIANRAAIHSVEPQGRNRVNTAFMLFTFLGQLTGTSAGNKLYERGGWVASGSLSVGLICLALFLCAIRGPLETGWYGWSGGFCLREHLASPEIKQSPTERFDIEIQNHGDGQVDSPSGKESD